MLVLTDYAATIIREVTAGHKATSGLRISRGNTDGSLDVVVTDAPADGDEIVERDGAAVFLAREISAPLDGRTLDASVDADDGTVTFSVTGRRVPEEGDIR
ncbi:hypothetical protein [Catenuloplanes indicus]|uniref:Fe-S cluster assembly iron-binding protein IscA n=1 Tax=Catenuloplanes indicus TaxID=137267 RepID=A0AAE4AWX2_9ACTN|nr:hypothetical protein [Catenuloplanes indicus]MDQ0365161.1 Fe-S cluster assembly iron-binding protein IscA [Catenuloplanes indicus]